MDVVDLLNDRETFAEDLIDDGRASRRASSTSRPMGRVVDSFLAERAIKLQEADAALAQRRDESRQGSCARPGSRPSTRRSASRRRRS